MSAEDFERAAADLRGLVKETQDDLMRRVVPVLESAVRAETPQRSGRLRRGISGRVERGGSRGVVDVDVPYARAVHEGTRAHSITPVRARALSWTGARHPVRSVRHPGSRANPFIDRGLARGQHKVDGALEAWGDAALERVG